MLEYTQAGLLVNHSFDVRDDWTNGAAFSVCRTWRYALWRRWNTGLSCDMVAFVGLNPSYADESINDPTIRRCINFAKDWGFEGIYMLNAYAFRATDPRNMKAASNPVGPKNDQLLRYYSGKAITIVACWGAHCEPKREVVVCEVIGKLVMSLGTTKNGRPKHPLYLRADTKPEPFWQPKV